MMQSHTETTRTPDVRSVITAASGALIALVMLFALALASMAQREQVVERIPEGLRLAPVPTSAPQTPLEVRAAQAWNAVVREPVVLPVFPATRAANEAREETARPPLVLTVVPTTLAVPVAEVVAETTDTVTVRVPAGAGWYAVLRALDWPLTEDAVSVARTLTGVQVLVAGQTLTFPREYRVAVARAAQFATPVPPAGEARETVPTPAPAQEVSAAPTPAPIFSVGMTGADVSLIYATGVYDDTVASEVKTGK